MHRIWRGAAGVVFGLLIAPAGAAGGGSAALDDQRLDPAAEVVLRRLRRAR